jgi:hypothetical protein
MNMAEQEQGSDALFGDEGLDKIEDQYAMEVEKAAEEERVAEETEPMEDEDG